MHRIYCNRQPYGHICFHPEPWGTIVLGALVGIPLLIVVTVIVVWIKYRNG